MNLAQVKKLNLPSDPGSYQFLDKAGRILYVGKAVNLKSRVLSYWQASTKLTPLKEQLITKIERIEFVEVDSEIEALLLEANLIKKHQPPYNIDLKDDKRFTYIQVSLDDEVPGVFATRQIGSAGRYFGPFVSASAVRETLKAIRTIWPYCTERRVKNKPCFYYQIGRCTGVCGAKIDRAEYLRTVIKPLILFLEGKKNKIIKNYELRIKNLEKRLKKFSPPYEGGEKEGVLHELNNLKWRLKQIEQVLANARVLSVGEKYAADVVELAKILGLPKVPERIEGYDTSNIFGHEAVGSMVVFKGGEPDKNEYRKFKIKLSPFVIPAKAGIQSRSRQLVDLNVGQYNGKYGDTQMLEEMLERRLGHDEWPRPDLILVDGGKAQLNIVLKTITKAGWDLPVLAISKGEGLRSAGAPDKIFWPGEKFPLSLPLNSPALHLLKRVRDEAHRFAITYHRGLRSKKMLR